MDEAIGVIRFAKIEDLRYIVDLTKKETASIGFIPKIAYEAAITGMKISKPGKRWTDVVKDRLWVCECNGDLVGFVLASFGRISGMVKTGRIAQICLQTDARMMQRGRMLLDAVIAYGNKRGTLAFRCGCADDLPSNIFWQTMGWQKIGDRFGMSHQNTWKQTSERKVNVYKFDLMDMFLTCK
jgi:hypothetical protein